jgi:ABC-type lipoprotein release transport system permease subunit
MLIAVSWRNIWRSKTRSLVVITAITLGIMAGVFSTAFMKGMMDKRIETAIHTELSHIQIHDSLFRKTSELKYYMRHADILAGEIDTMTHVEGVTQRIIVQSMVSSAETGAGVKIMGVKPDAEKKVTDIAEHLVAGKYFEGVRRNPIVLGQKLADKLNVRVRSKVVITLQDLDNNLTAGAFRVAGIYKTSNTVYDESNVFVRYEDLARLTDIPPGACHEIAIRVDNAKVEEGKTTSRVYPKGTFDLFAGEQLVVVGRYKKPGNAKVVVQGAVGGLVFDIAAQRPGAGGIQVDIRAIPIGPDGGS